VRYIILSQSSACAKSYEKWLTLRRGYGKLFLLTNCVEAYARPLGISILTFRRSLPGSIFWSNRSCRLEQLPIIILGCPKKIPRF